MVVDLESIKWIMEPVIGAACAWSLWLAKQAHAVKNKVTELEKQVKIRDILCNECKKALSSGSDKFMKLEKVSNDTQMDLLKSVKETADANYEFRQAVLKDFVSKDDLEGKVIIICSRYCRENCHGK